MTLDEIKAAVRAGQTVIWENPKFAPNDIVETPMGEHQRVVQCDLWGCTVDNGTPRGARYAPEVLVRVARALRLVRVAACEHDVTYGEAL